MNEEETMKLYHQPWSPNCEKPLIAINELSVTDDVEIIHYNPFEVREDWFLDLNPAHKVPVLVETVKPSCGNRRQS